MIQILVLMVLLFPVRLYATDFSVKNVDHLFDLTGGGGLAISLPTDVAVDQNHIVVADGTNNRLLVYDIAGRLLYPIGKPEVEFNYPVGLTIYKGNLYVADTGNHEVKVITLGGKLLYGIKIFAEHKPERPIDVVVDENGKELYVTCNNSQKVQVYNIRGKLLRSWGRKGDHSGEFRYPATIASIDSNKKVIVDVLNARAQVFDNSGEHIRNIGGRGMVQGKFFRPKGVAVDEANRIYVSDSYTEVVQVFDQQGTFKYILGSQNSIMRFSAPVGMAIAAKRLYVVESLGNKVSVFSIK